MTSLRMSITSWSFGRRTRRDWRRDQVSLRFVPYSHFPAVHGFAYGPNTYFVSFASRDGNGRVQIPYEDVFLRVERTDIGEQARALRSLFENWVEAATWSSQNRGRASLERFGD